MSISPPAVHPYGAGYVALSYGQPSVPPFAAVGPPVPILNSSATSTAVPYFPYGTAPPVFPGLSAASYYTPTPHPLSYASMPPTLGFPSAQPPPSHLLPQLSFPYATAGYGPTPYATPVGWPYGMTPPLATTAGPFAGAAVQTHTSSPPAAESGNSKGDASSKDGSSPVDAKSATLVPGSDTNSSSSGPQRSGHHPADGDAGFNLASSNRAICENRQLIVKFLTDDTTEQQFRELFKRFGPVENARIIYDKKTGHTKGFGFITYKHAEHAVQALRNMGGYQLHGRQLNVALAQTERKRAFSPVELSPRPQPVTPVTA